MKDKDKNIKNLFGDSKRVSPFRLPENYFETFADRLKVRIEQEERRTKKKSLLIYLKPVLTVAASFVLVLLTIYVPIKKKFFTTDNSYIAQHQSNNDLSDSINAIPAALFSYFSENQFLAAVKDMNDFESKTVSSDNLADYITANYNDFEIIANN